MVRAAAQLRVNLHSPSLWNLQPLPVRLWDGPQPRRWHVFVEGTEIGGIGGLAGKWCNQAGDGNDGASEGCPALWK